MTGIVLPGDKSIAHRFLILASVAEGTSVLSNVPDSLDVGSTVSCLRCLGVDIEAASGGEMTVSGGGRWTAPTAPLECGNSGTTARLLTGLITGLGIAAELRGDASLSRRPMDRVVYPLQAMGGRITYAHNTDRLPVRIESRASGSLRALRYRPRVSSAQVRGALLLAAVSGRTDLEILDRLRPRDHTERILRHLGVPVASERVDRGERIRFRASDWDGRLGRLQARVPGDASAAAFMAVSALLNEREIRMESVGLNPTRLGSLEVLREMGADIQTRSDATEAGEPVGDITIGPARLKPLAIEGGIVPQLIDEIPVLAVLASRLDGVSTIRGAAELRVKESDRIALLASNLRALGVRCEEAEDGLTVHGTAGKLRGAVRTGGDHRIAMAFGVLGESPGCDISVDDMDCVNVSYPGFWDALRTVASGGSAS